MQIVPVNDAYAQTLSAQLGGQSVGLTLYQKSTGFYVDVYVGQSLIIGGVLCVDRVRIVRDAYLGFVGDLVFVDAQGTSNPSSPGLGSRFLLYYLAPADAVAL